MDYKTLYDIAKSTEMIGRVTIAAIRVAITVLNEDEVAFAKNHALRVITAKRVLNSPETVAATISLLVVVNDEVIAKTIGSEKPDLSAVDDAQIEQAVIGVWDAIS